MDISGKITDSLLQNLKANGANILVSMPAYDSLRAEVALDRLEAIADSPDVRFIQPKQEYMTSRHGGGGGDPRRGGAGTPARPARAERVRERLTQAIARYGSSDKTRDPGVTPSVGARQSEGDVTHRANIARARYGVDGTGLKIGVISDGVINISFAQASGDLPPDVTVLPGQSGSGDEGTAILEIVHDLASARNSSSPPDSTASVFSQTTSGNSVRRVATSSSTICSTLWRRSTGRSGPLHHLQHERRRGDSGRQRRDRRGRSVLLLGRQLRQLERQHFRAWEGDFVSGGAITTPTGSPGPSTTSIPRPP
ncbi:MAG: hypothetical protein WKH64_18245 [Chloroflexia bacterium]